MVYGIEVMCVVVWCKSKAITIHHLTSQLPDPGVGGLGEGAALGEVGGEVAVHLVHVVLDVRQPEVDQVLARIAAVPRPGVLKQRGRHKQVLYHSPEVGEGDGHPQQEGEGGHQVDLGHGVPAVLRAGEPEAGAVHEQAGGHLAVAVAAVVAGLGHAVVPEHEQHGVGGQLPDHGLQHAVHLGQLARHLGVVRPVLVTRVVHAQVVPDKHVPRVGSLQVGLQHLGHVPVHRVEVPHVKGRHGELLCEGGGVEVGPGVVPGEHHASAVTDQLIHDVVLGHRVRAEVAGHVNEGGEAAGGEPLQPLHGGGGRVGQEAVQLARHRGLARAGGRAVLLDHGQLVDAVAAEAAVVRAEVVPEEVVIVISSGRRNCNCKLAWAWVLGLVLPQSVHQQHHGLAEHLGRLAAVLRAAFCPVGKHLGQYNLAILIVNILCCLHTCLLRRKPLVNMKMAV